MATEEMGTVLTDIAASPLRTLTRLAVCIHLEGNTNHRPQEEKAMWRMPDGDRVLSEPEWALFRTGVELLRDSIEQDLAADSDHTHTGIDIFDRLTAEQKLALLADTVGALRDPATPTPPDTDANEGAIAAVFSMIRVGLETELDIAALEGDEEKPTDIRRLLRAVSEAWEEREQPLPDETASNADEWDGLLQEFEDRIFWDTDFALGDGFLDLPPDEARAKLAFSGIDPDYYRTVPDEPDKAGLTTARQMLARLLGLPVPGNEGLDGALDNLFRGPEV
jgi:hypothetical protein